jgi:hypothetical protein
MVEPNTGAAPAASSPQPHYTEFVVKRDGGRPLSFAGIQLARAAMTGLATLTSLTAVVYQTKAGKFVTSLTSESRVIGAIEQLARPILESKHGQYAKAAVFNSFDEAMSWFRPGRLTDEIRKQLGLDVPERIE